MGKRDANIQRDMFQESKRFVGMIAQQGPGQVPIVADDLNDSENIFFNLLRRLEKTSLGDGFDGTAFQITSNSTSNDFSITGGDGSDDGAKRGYLSGIPLTKYNTNNFSSTSELEIHSKSTELTASILTDTASNYETNELVGRTLYPNIQFNSGFVITANTATTITVTGNMLAVATAGDKYRIGLTTPSSSRTDTVLLDVYIDEIDTTEDPSLYHNIARASGSVSIESAIRKKVEQKIWVKQDYNNTPDDSYIDIDGNTHYVTRLATFARSSGVAVITANDITDLRKQDFPDRNSVYQEVRVETQLSASGTIILSGTLDIWNDCSNRPEFHGGLYIEGCDFDFNDVNKDFNVNSDEIRMSGTNINLDSDSIVLSGTSSFYSEAADTIAARFFNNSASKYSTWIDGNGRLHSEGLIEGQQFQIKASGTSDKSLIIYDYPSGTLERFYVRENGQIYQLVESNLSSPAYEISLSGDLQSDVPAVKISGGLVNSQAVLFLENTDSTGGNTPTLRLKNNALGSGSTHSALQIVNYDNNGNSIEAFTHGLMLFKPKHASTDIIVVRDNTNSRNAFKVNSLGEVEIYAGPLSNALLVRRNSTGLPSSFLTEAGLFTIRDDSSSTPGYLVQNAAGVNKARLNINGLILSSAEITQNSTSPTTLNVYSNDGIVQDYDYNDDGAGTLVIEAGSTPVAKFNTNTNPYMNLYRDLIVGSSGTTDSKIRLETAAGATGNSSIEIASPSVGEEVHIEFTSTQFRIYDEARSRDIFRYQHDSTGVIRIGHGTSVAGSEIELNARHFSRPDGFGVGQGTFASGSSTATVLDPTVQTSSSTHIFITPTSTINGRWHISAYNTLTGFEVTSTTAENATFSYFIVTEI